MARATENIQSWPVHRDEKTGDRWVEIPNKEGPPTQFTVRQETLAEVLVDTYVDMTNNPDVDRARRWELLRHMCTPEEISEAVAMVEAARKMVSQ